MDDALAKPAFKNYTIGLVIFGVIDILFGLVCALFVPVMLWTASMAASHAKDVPAMEMRGIVSGCLFYGLLAIAMVWLGVGSILCRRWARALLLIYSWFWLVVGLITLGMLACIGPDLFKNPALEASGPTASTVLAIILVSIGLFFVAAPLIGVLFYGNRHVKATCEAKNPAPSWTDACPLPVLALSLMFAVSIPMMLISAAAYHGVIALFGTILSGGVGGSVYVFLAALSAYLAWATFRLERTAWWIILALVVVFSISNIVTYSMRDFIEVYRRMDLPESSVDSVRQLKWMSSGFMVGMSILYAVIAGGYVLYTGRFFKKREAIPQP